MNISYNIGDKIRIIKPAISYFGWYFNMDQFVGRTFVIVGIEPYDSMHNQYFFEDMPKDMQNYMWGEDMFELVENYADSAEVQASIAAWEALFKDYIQ